MNKKELNKEMKQAGCRIFEKASFSDYTISRNSDCLNLKLKIIEKRRNSINWA